MNWRESLTRRGAIVVIQATLIHLWWALGVALDERAMQVTALSGIAAFCVHQGTVVGAFLVSAICAAWGLLRRSGPVSAALMAPQQTLMIWSAWTAVECISRGSYGDLEPRSPWFIAVDQGGYVVLALTHLWGVFLLHGGRPWKSRVG